MPAPHRAVVTHCGTWTTPSALPVLRQAERSGLIEQSHLRCAALGLTRVGRPDFEPMMRSDLSVARERNQRLSSHAAPVMEMLFEQIVNTESMIVLTDAQGTILHSVGDDEFLARADKVALSPGVNWAEQSKGTNAIGTALFEERPTLVHGGEHFIHANSFLTCSAAPIFDPRGNMLGVLDVTGDQRSYHQHTMGLVRMSARMIENHWLSDDCGDRLRLHFHTRVEFIDTLLEGIVVVGADGKILGANRSALDQLDMSSAALRMNSLTSLFGTTVSAMIDHFRTPLPVPMCLSLSNGRQFHVAARIKGPTHSMIAGLEIGEARPVRSAGVEPGAYDSGRSASSSGLGSGRLSGLHYLKTGDPQIETVVSKVQRVLNRDIPLLILGETGTGKELLARAVHQDSNRARQTFVAVNCASIPESLIEAELFGYEDGAFTGARRKGASGRIVQANGGTLFLDEIGDMPLALQARLLRVLQERCVTPLGSQKSIAVDIAVVGATHRDLRRMIEAGAFREDLYYRLNGLVVRLPPLRERSDLGTVAQRILLAECPHATLEISPAVMAAGERQITEEHLSDDFLEDVHRPATPGATVAASAPQAVDTPSPLATAATEGASERVDEPQAERPAGRDTGRDSARDTARDTGRATEPDTERTLGEAEIEMIRAVLAAANGNISEASKRLGISRNTIYRKLRWSKPA